MIEVMQAYVDGKKIETKSKNDSNWYDYDANREPYWHWDKIEYRIKPEPKLRPLKPEELITLKGKWLRHHKDEQMEGLVTGVNYSHSVVILMGRFIGLEELYRDWTYEDGTPVGVLE